MSDWEAKMETPAGVISQEWVLEHLTCAKVVLGMHVLPDELYLVSPIPGAATKMLRLWVKSKVAEFSTENVGHLVSSR